MPRSLDPNRREQVLARAVSDGKITTGRVDHYRALYDRDPGGTEQLLQGLAGVLVPGVESLVQAAEPVLPVGQYPTDPDAGTGRIFHAKDGG